MRVDRKNYYHAKLKFITMDIFVLSRMWIPRTHLLHLLRVLDTFVSSFHNQSNDPHTKCRQLICCQWIPQTTNVFWPLKRIPLNVASLHHLSEVSAVNLLFLRLDFIVCQWTPQPILLFVTGFHKKNFNCYNMDLRGCFFIS